MENFHVLKHIITYFMVKSKINEHKIANKIGGMNVLRKKL